MRTLLHISDLHFGPQHVPHLAAGVLALIDERRPSLVAISGDLTQRAKPAEFLAAREFVDRIPVPWLAVPGNHDVPLYRVWERLFSPLGAYRKYFSSDLGPVYRDGEILAVGINSAHGLTLREGWVRRRRLAAASALLRGAPAGSCRVVVLHHHLVAAPNFRYRGAARNAPLTIERLAAAGADLVLAGHQHVTFLGTSAKFHPAAHPPLILAHAGTTTSGRRRGVEHGHNSCNWIVIEREEIAVTPLRWDETVRAFALLERHAWPRNR